MGLMCDRRLDYGALDDEFGGEVAKDYAREIASLGDLEDEGLLVRSEEGIQVMPRGVPLLRVIAMRFDATFTPGEGRHSKTI
jgi:oxygen-independent coproporphyrinogen-3 oxidase